MFFKVVHERGRSCVRAVARHAVMMTNACIESNGPRLFIAQRRSFCRGLEVRAERTRQ